jgi:hypothetical protein
VIWIELALLGALVTSLGAAREVAAQDAPSASPEDRRYSWPEVEAALANVHAARGSNPKAYEHLSEWYNFLTDPNCTGSQNLADHCVQLENWRKQSPQFPTPLIVLANAEMRRAWESRGTAPDAAIGNSERQAFQAHVLKVGELLNEAIKRGVKDGKAHTILLEVATARGLPLADARTIMEAGARLDPAFDDLYVAMAEYLLPRWHGKPGDVERFAAEIAKRLPGEDGLAVYGHIAYFVNQFDSNILFWGDYDWELLVKAAEVLVKRSPQARNLVPFAALCTLAANDHAAARRIRPFVQSNDAPRVRLWGVVSAEFFRWCSAEDVTARQADCLWGAPLIHGGLAFGSDNRSI